MTTVNNSMLDTFAKHVKENIFNHNNWEVHNIDYNNFNHYLGLFKESVESNNPFYSPEYKSTSRKNRDESQFEELFNGLRDMLPFSVGVFSASLRFLTTKKYVFFKNNGHSLSIMKEFSNLDLPYANNLGFIFQDLNMTHKLSNLIFDNGMFFSQISYYLHYDMSKNNYTLNPDIRHDDQAEFSISSVNEVFKLELFTLDGCIKEKIFALKNKCGGRNAFETINKEIEDFLLPFTCSLKNIDDVKVKRKLTKDYCDFFEKNLREVVSMVEY